VCRTKGVVHKQVAEPGKLFAHGGIVLFLALVKAGILQEQHLARLERRGEGLDLGTDAVGRHLDRPAEELAQARGDRRQAHLGDDRAFGAAQVRWVAQPGCGYRR